ncbi:MAG: hypothetical protein ACRDQY_03390 [Pseudonocardiaceae bacterium]
MNAMQARSIGRRIQEIRIWRQMSLKATAETRRHHGELPIPDWALSAYEPSGETALPGLPWRPTWTSSTRCCAQRPTTPHKASYCLG